MTAGVGCAAYLSCTDAARMRVGQRPAARAQQARPARGRARTVLGVVLVVGAVAELAELRQAGAEQAALLRQPHRELGAAGHRCARVHQRAHGRQEQLCARRGAPESRGAACARGRRGAAARAPSFLGVLLALPVPHWPCAGRARGRQRRAARLQRRPAGGARGRARACWLLPKVYEWPSSVTTALWCFPPAPAAGGRAA